MKLTKTKKEKVEFIFDLLKTGNDEKMLINKIEYILGEILYCKKCGMSLMNHYAFTHETGTWGQTPCGGISSFKFNQQ